MTTRIRHPVINPLGRFHKETDGAIAILFVLFSIPLLLLSGLVIDDGVNSMAQQGLHDAADSTVISLLKLPLSTTSADLEAQNV